MAFYHEDIQDIDLESGSVHRSFLHHTLAAGDNFANRFGVHLLRGGQEELIGGGTCIGYFIRHKNEDTVVINGGTFAGSRAYVTLPASCYAVEGNFTLVIKLIGAEGSATRIIDGSVVKSTTDVLTDPGTTIPSLAELTAIIERAETAAATINGLTITDELISETRYKISIVKPT